MDLQMEPLDGIASTRQIRSRYSAVEVVALTSFGEEERVHAALEAGASVYLLKDSEADEVSAAIRAAHSGELPGYRPGPDIVSPRRVARRAGC